MLEMQASCKKQTSTMHNLFVITYRTSSSEKPLACAMSQLNYDLHSTNISMQIRAA